ncbi:MAG: hypothetical protein QHJ73_19550, partial [Armatimonadota bacterium]|nr:hypothetical protein [Armatimonadota bacterium]
TFRLKENDDKIRQELLKRIVAKLKDRETFAPIPNPFANMVAKLHGEEAAPEEVPLRILDATPPNIFMKVKTSLTAPSTSDADFDKKLKQWEEESKKSLKEARETERIDRYFDGTVEMKKVPVVLQNTLRELSKRDPAVDLKAKVTVVVGRRRLALVLFRQ